MFTNKIDSSTTFGTQVKVSQGIRNYYARYGKADILDRSIKALETNGEKDIFACTKAINQRGFEYIHADYFKEANGQKCVGTTVIKNFFDPKYDDVSELDKSFPDMVTLYKLAKQKIMTVW